MLLHIAESAAGTVLGLIVFLAGWLAFDWWFDTRAINRDYPDDNSKED